MRHVSSRRSLASLFVCIALACGAQVAQAAETEAAPKTGLRQWWQAKVRPLPARVVDGVKARLSPPRVATFGGAVLLRDKARWRRLQLKRLYFSGMSVVNSMAGVLNTAAVFTSLKQGEPGWAVVNLALAAINGGSVLMSRHEARQASAGLQEMDAKDTMALSSLHHAPRPEPTPR